MKKNEENISGIRTRELTDEELKLITGGGMIGDIYGDCEDFKNDCISLGIGVDICNIIYNC